MPFQQDLTGKQFGRWTALRKSDRRTKDGKRQPYWWCRCQCGTEREVLAGDLRRGNKDGRSGSLSCGCLMRKLKSIPKHGMCDHPAYCSWKNARSRCHNTEDTNYYLYGGRGIRFDERWDDFTAFWEEMGTTWAYGLTLDRIDPDSDYGPCLCRWATRKEQANNRRFHGVTPAK